MSEPVLITEPILRTRRLSTVLDLATVRRVEAAAEAEQRSVSGWIRSVIVDALDRTAT